MFGHVELGALKQKINDVLAMREGVQSQARRLAENIQDLREIKQFDEYADFLSKTHIQLLRTQAQAVLTSSTVILDATVLLDQCNKQHAPFIEQSKKAINDLMQRLDEQKINTEDAEVYRHLRQLIIAGIKKAIINYYKANKRAESKQNLSDLLVPFQRSKYGCIVAQYPFIFDHLSNSLLISFTEEFENKPLFELVDLADQIQVVTKQANVFIGLHDEKIANTEKTFAQYFSCKKPYGILGNYEFKPVSPDGKNLLARMRATEDDFLKNRSNVLMLQNNNTNLNNVVLPAIEQCRKAIAATKAAIIEPVKDESKRSEAKCNSIKSQLVDAEKKLAHFNEKSIQLQATIAEYRRLLQKECSAEEKKRVFYELISLPINQTLDDIENQTAQLNRAKISATQSIDECKKLLAAMEPSYHGRFYERSLTEYKVICQKLAAVFYEPNCETQCRKLKADYDLAREQDILLNPAPVISVQVPLTPPIEVKNDKVNYALEFQNILREIFSNYNLKHFWNQHVSFFGKARAVISNTRVLIDKEYVAVTRGAYLARNELNSLFCSDKLDTVALTRTVEALKTRLEKNVYNRKQPVNILLRALVDCLDADGKLNLNERNINHLKKILQTIIFRDMQISPPLTSTQIVPSTHSSLRA
jgi:hypothetical protein